MKKLSPAQERALRMLKAATGEGQEWRTAFSLGYSSAALDALVRQGLVETRKEPIKAMGKVFRFYRVKGD